jgi:hypothetical protein
MVQSLCRRNVDCAANHILPPLRIDGVHHLRLIARIERDQMTELGGSAGKPAFVLGDALRGWRGRTRTAECSGCANSAGSSVAPSRSNMDATVVAEIAAELVRLKVAVIVMVGSAVPAAKQATSAIPIVFAISGDPAGMALVASLAQPGLGNDPDRL